MKYKEFKPMVNIHTKEIKGERFNIKHVTLTDEDVDKELRTAWRKHGGMNEVRGLEAGTYVVLRDSEKREIIMSDTWMEQMTNIEFVRNANGHVLIAGLGIGMVVMAIQDKPEVESITVVELEQGIYDIVMPALSKHLNSKVKVVIGDIHDFQPEIKYDTIYCDIWNDISGGNWDEMKILTKKFKYQVNRTNKESFLDHWRKDDTIRLNREGSRGYGW